MRQSVRTRSILWPASKTLDNIPLIAFREKFISTIPRRVRTFLLLSPPPTHPTREEKQVVREFVYGGSDKRRKGIETFCSMFWSGNRGHDDRRGCSTTLASSRQGSRLYSRAPVQAGTLINGVAWNIVAIPDARVNVEEMADTTVIFVSSIRRKTSILRGGWSTFRRRAIVEKKKKRKTRWRRRSRCEIFILTKDRHSRNLSSNCSKISINFYRAPFLSNFSFCARAHGSGTLT